MATTAIWNINVTTDMMNTTTPEPDFTTSYIYFFLTAIMSTLSIIGCLTIFVTYILFKDLHTKGRQLLVFLSIADFLTAFGNFMGVIWVISGKSLGMPYCKAHSALTSFSSISSYLWNSCMALFLFVSLVLQNPNVSKKLEIPFHLCCWIIPFGVTVSAISVDVYGTDPGAKGPSWCWIKGTRSDTMFWQFFTGKAWEIFAYIFVTFFYGGTVLYLAKQKHKMRKSLGDAASNKKGKKKSAIDEANRRLIFVPLIFITLRIWGTLRFLTHQGWMALPQGFGDSGQGFSNAVLFCLLTKSVREHIFPCCKSQENSNEAGGATVNTQATSVA